MKNKDITMREFMQEASVLDTKVTREALLTINNLSLGEDDKRKVFDLLVNMCKKEANTSCTAGHNDRKSFRSITASMAEGAAMIAEATDEYGENKLRLDLVHKTLGRVSLSLEIEGKNLETDDKSGDMSVH